MTDPIRSRSQVHPQLHLFAPRDAEIRPTAGDNEIAAGEQAPPDLHRLVQPVLAFSHPPLKYDLTHSRQIADTTAMEQSTDENASDLYARWNAHALAAARYKPRLVPAELRGSYAASTSLPAFYRDCCSGRWEPVRKDVRATTDKKDRLCLRRWCWGTRPIDWPARHPWEGPSLAVIEASNSVLLDEFVQRLETGSMERATEPYSGSTIHTTWGPLRTILHHAVAMQAISRFAEPSGLPEKEVEARPYNDEELERLWPMLHAQPLLRAALVVSVNCGLRPVDLFCLKREELVQDALGRWTLKFKATKTAKRHWLPLADVTVRALRFAIAFADRGKLPGFGGEYFFPGLSQPLPPIGFSGGKDWDPEDSFAARRRAKLTRLIWDAAGLNDVERAWQSGRSTCATRLALKNRDAAKFMLGTSSPDVFTTHYAPAREDFWQAVLTLPQPACFLREFGADAASRGA
jgi:integrase